MSPKMAARVAARLFVSPNPRRELRPSERRIMDKAAVSKVRVRSCDVTVYEWAAGPDVVLLVHDWAGRASEFGLLIASIRARGFTVVAFDAPASGESTGATADIGDYVDIMRRIQRTRGPLLGVIGHSFGALAALCAVKEGLEAHRVVGVSPVPDLDHVLSEFARKLQLSDDIMAELVEHLRLTRSLGDGDIRERYSGVRNPVRVPTLFVQHAGDVPVAASERLRAAHGESSRLLLASNLRYSSVLSLETFDDVVGFLAGGLVLNNEDTHELG
jgi:pimeloyl-ACP methyl ester carboxylesterase